jgi:hypothetical protein
VFSLDLDPSRMAGSFNVAQGGMPILRARFGLTRLDRVDDPPAGGALSQLRLGQFGTCREGG